MSAHEIVWTHEDGSVSADAVCNDAECIHRYNCEHACEWLYDVVRAPDGSVSHNPAPYDEEPRMRHTMSLGDECNFILFLNADSYVLPELRDGDGPLEIGRTPIVPSWQGEDGALWKAVTS